MKYLKNVSTLALDSQKCILCKKCLEVCPHAVLAIQDNKLIIESLDSCMECGACQKNCPVNALTVKAGVGCAAAFIYGFLNNTEPSCDCSGSNKSGCC